MAELIWSAHAVADSHRELLLGNYRIIYRFNPEQNSVYVVTVVHGSRLLKEAHLQ